MTADEQVFRAVENQGRAVPARFKEKVNFSDLVFALSETLLPYRLTELRQLSSDLASTF
ncbi:hypothetical protein [Bradyrhizobium sp. USDA 3315]